MGKTLWGWKCREKNSHSWCWSMHNDSPVTSRREARIKAKHFRSLNKLTYVAIPLSEANLLK